MYIYWILDIPYVYAGTACLHFNSLVTQWFWGSKIIPFIDFMTYIIPSSMHCPIPSTYHAKLIWYQKKHHHHHHRWSSSSSSTYNIHIMDVILHHHQLGGQVTARAMHNSPFRLLRRIQQKTWDPLSRSYASCNCDASYKMFMWHPASGILLTWSSQSWLSSLSAFSLWKRERETSLQKAYVSVLFYCMYYKRGHPKNTLHSQDRSSCSDEPLGPVCAATSYHRVATICRPKTSNPRSWHLFNFGGNESWNPTAWTNPFNNPWVKSVGIGN